MEPQLPTPQRSPEMGQPYRPPEVVSAPRTPESAPAPQGPERGADAGERPSDNRDNAGAPQQAPVIPAAPPPIAIPVSNDIHASSTNSPAIAADEDLIEKEWVEKAKKVIAETRHDPFLQEREVSKLQADYLKKRYGKEVKLSPEG